MHHCKVFEAVSHCLCDLVWTTAPYGGWVLICCSDFRQIPPVILGGGPQAIAEATIKSSQILPAVTHPQLYVGDTAYSNCVDHNASNHSCHCHSDGVCVFGTTGSDH